jgi:phosphate transport system protein
MTRTALDRELVRLQDDMITLGSKVSRALEQAVGILERQDLVAAERLIAADQAIDEQRYAMEGDILVAIARHQPMANDLRTLAAMLEIIADLERIGDYAEGIAKITLLLGDEDTIPPMPQIPEMARRATDMLNRALGAFLEGDVELARAIPREDDLVDALYNEVNHTLLQMTLANPRMMEQANCLVWAAHNLERSADRVTNICERVVFTVTGDMQELDYGS